VRRQQLRTWVRRVAEGRVAGLMVVSAGELSEDMLVGVPAATTRTRARRAIAQRSGDAPYRAAPSSVIVVV